MDADHLETCMDRLNELDQDLARTVYKRCESLMEFKALQSDKRVRYNRPHLLAKGA